MLTNILHVHCIEMKEFESPQIVHFAILQVYSVLPITEVQFETYFFGKRQNDF